MSAANGGRGSAHLAAPASRLESLTRFRYLCGTTMGEHLRPAAPARPTQTPRARPIRGGAWAAGLLLALACALVRAGDAGPQTEAFARMLAQFGSEPLAVIATPNLRALAEAFSRTALGRALADPQYEQGRAELLRLAGDAAGADLGALWAGLRPHAAGPAALVVQQAEIGQTAAPLVTLTLCLVTRDAQGADAARLGWPASDGTGLLARTSLRAQAVDQLLAARAAPWAAGLSAGKGLLRMRVRPAALREYAGVARKEEEAAGLPWRGLLRALCLRELDELELDTQLAGESFVEELRARAGEGSGGKFTRLLGALKAEPGSWAPVRATLPAGQDMVVLMQADVAALGADLPAALQLLERFVRGERWTRAQGQAPAAAAPDRFKFLLPYLAGTLGLAGRATASGEGQAVLVAATPVLDVEKVRRGLADGLAALGATFEVAARAPAIGGHAPLAAQFKGRGLLPAPVIGMSEGWLWLCSNTAAYQELTSSLGAGGRTLAAELAGQIAPAADTGAFPPSALYFRCSLEKVLPLLYTSWMLGEGGPRLGGWRPPGELLPPPGFLKKYLAPCEADLAREGASVRVRARGPLPLSAYAPLLAAIWAADALAELERTRPESLQRQIEALRKTTPGAKD